MEKETRELFNVLLKEIGSVREDVRNVKGEIRSVREEVGKEISSLREEVSSLREEVRNVKGELSSVREEVRNVKGELSSVREEVKNVKRELKSVKEETKELFNILVEEMGSMEDRVNKRFERIDNTLETMQHEINACKLDKDTVSLLVRKTNELDKRVEILEIKTA